MNNKPKSRLRQLAERARAAVPRRQVTDEELRRLVGHERWSWAEGMLTDRGRVCIVNHGDAMVVPGGCVAAGGWWASASLLPIPSDPATAGCLLDMLAKREGGSMVAAVERVRERLTFAPRSAFGDLVALVLLEAWEATDD